MFSIPIILSLLNNIISTYSSKNQITTIKNTKSPINQPSYPHIHIIIESHIQKTIINLYAININTAQLQIFKQFLNLCYFNNIFQKCELLNQCKRRHNLNKFSNYEVEFMVKDAKDILWVFSTCFMVFGNINITYNECDISF